MLGKRLLYRLGLCGLAVAMGLQAGCLSFCHPVTPLPKEEVQAPLDLPHACKNGVYVFFLHGIDPLDIANLAGLHDYIQSLGFIKTYYGQPFHVFHYEKEILALRKRDPKARIVLIGFSYGAGLLRDLTCTLKGHRIDVDLLVYIDGVPLDARPLLRPSNVRKVVNILAFARRDKHIIRDAENLRYDDVWHFGTVTHPDTLRMLVRELTEVAMRVPVITHIPTMPPPEGVLPAPKPEGVLPAPTPVPAPELLPAPEPTAKRGEWDFLKPDGNANGMPGRRPNIEAMTMPPATTVEK